MTTTTPPAITYDAPAMRAGASEPVYRDGRYCGAVTRELHESGIGWTFHAGGPYGNLSHGGFMSLDDAARFLAAHDDFGHQV